MPQVQTQSACKTDIQAAESVEPETLGVNGKLGVFSDVDKFVCILSSLFMKILQSINKKKNEHILKKASNVTNHLANP